MFHTILNDLDYIKHIVGNERASHIKFVFTCVRHQESYNWYQETIISLHLCITTNY